MAQRDNATEPRTRRGPIVQPGPTIAPQETVAPSMSTAPEATIARSICRGAWARVTSDNFRHFSKTVRDIGRPTDRDVVPHDDAVPEVAVGEPAARADGAPLADDAALQLLPGPETTVFGG